MSQKRVDEIKGILYETIQAETFTSWGVIVDAISGKVKIKNWYEVRNVLQWLLDNSIIKRVSDIHNEEYLRIGKIK